MDISFDFIDKKILKALLNKGRSTFAELAAQVGLTAPTVHDRVKKLERSGMIKGYTTLVNSPMLGYHITAFLSITTSTRVTGREYESRLADISEIQKCYSVAGEETYVALVITRNPRTLEQLLQRIKSIPGTVAINTKVVLSSPINRNTLPLPADEEVREFPGDQPALARSSQSV